MNRTSCMLAIPVNVEEILQPEQLIHNLKESKDFQVLSATVEEHELQVQVVFDKCRYEVLIYPTDFQLPRFYRMQHFFPDVDMEELAAKEDGLVIEMNFGEDALAAYHLQLKLIQAMLPNLLAVLDESAEKILSGRWIALAASSNVPPAPRYLYTIQAVSGEDGQVWMHSHGLNRCGITELEILGATRENYQSQSNIIESMASRMMEREEPLEPMEPLFLARLSQQHIVMATYMSWDKAIEFYDADILGGKADREEGHNQDTSCIFVYPTEEDYNKGVVGMVSIFDELLEQNPMYMLSQNETERMKALALERLAYVKNIMGTEGVKVLMKLGLEIDEEHRTEDNFKEHIWFELLEISGLTVTAKLTQEPYYINDLHEGAVNEYPIDCITDWIIFTPDYRVTPDDVYLLDL